MNAPRVIVCAGGGGVGKTTTSAALALSFANDGFNTLVVTVDPARRLAQALGVELGAEVRDVSTVGNGRLHALMPDPALSSKHFLRILFDGAPASVERVEANPVYAALSSGLAGMHEVVSLMLIARAVEEHAYDVVVVDTAPSRYALDFVGYPGRLASLFEGKAVGWFAALAPKAKTQDLDEQSSDGGLLSWGKRKAEALVAKILGPSTAEAITDLFGELARARERFANLSRTAETLLLGEQTRFILVAAPTGSAVADAEYLATHLVDLGKRPSAIVLNRADRDVPSWLRGDPNAAPDALSELLELARRERGAIVKAADAAERELRSRIPKATLVRLPTVDDWDPRRVVETLGTELEPLGASITRAPSPSRAPSA